jgi:hypothetical protein
MDTFWLALGSISAALTALVAVVAAVYAARQWKSTEQQRRSAQRAEQEATRPYVTVGLEESPTSPMILDLVIRNIGRRPAVDLSVTITPPPERAREADNAQLRKTRMLNEPTAWLSPGQEMATLFDSLKERHGRTDLPDRYDVEISYHDTSGTSYSETAVLDLKLNAGALTAHVRGLHDLAGSVAKIAKALSNASIMGRVGYITVRPHPSAAKGGHDSVG